MAPSGGQLLVRRTCFSLSDTSMESAADPPPAGLSVFIRCRRGPGGLLSLRLACAAPQKSRRSRSGTPASLCQGAESPMGTGDSGGVRVHPRPRQIRDHGDGPTEGMIPDCRRVPSSRTQA